MDGRCTEAGQAEAAAEAEAEEASPDRHTDTHTRFGAIVPPPVWPLFNGRDGTGWVGYAVSGAGDVVHDLAWPETWWLHSDAHRDAGDIRHVIGLPWGGGGGGLFEERLYHGAAGSN